MKYKLIKEYPGSLKLGTVVEAPEDCQTRFIIVDRVCFTYDQGLLDRYPEYWEKVLSEEGLFVSVFGSLVYSLSDGSAYGFTHGIQSNYWFTKSWEFPADGRWRKATEQEKEKFVKMTEKECERHRLFEDTKIEYHAGSDLKAENTGDFGVLKNPRIIDNNNGRIFYRGEFATPLKEEPNTHVLAVDLKDYNKEETESGVIILTPKNK